MTNQKNKKHHQNAAPAFPAQDRRFQMTNAPKPLTASAIKYLLILLELCKNETGARCMDIAGQLHVTKPSVHSMIGNLCSAGLAEKKKYGNVFLTPAGRAEAERYAGCCQQLSGRMQQSLGLNAEDAHSAYHSRSRPLINSIYVTIIWLWPGKVFWRMRRLSTRSTGLVD